MATIMAFILGSSIGVAVAGYVHPGAGSNTPGMIKIVNCTDVGFSATTCAGQSIGSSAEWTAFQTYSNNLAQSGGFGFATTMQDCDASSCGNLKFVYEVP